MRNRYRWMYKLTGLPGWMRMGFSPGWQGRNPTGLGPCTQYLMTGNWPTPEMEYAWQHGYVPFSTTPGIPTAGFQTLYDPWLTATLTKEQELNLLKMEAEQLKDELYTIEKKIKEIEGEKK